MTIPLFKSHYSIGKSILTLGAPNASRNPAGATSIFDIATENNLSELVLVEDSFMGFLEAQKISEQLGINFIFGLRFDVCQDVTDISDESLRKCSHKVIIFLKNAAGYKTLNHIYTQCKTIHNGWLDLSVLSDLWRERHLSLAIPFYDSFIFKNLTSFNACVPNFPFTSPTFFTEDNSLPFDGLIREGVNEYACSQNSLIQPVQSIYYNRCSDFDSYLAYKLICGRNSFAGRSLSLEKPNFDHLGSNEFCWESYLNKYESA